MARNKVAEALTSAPKVQGAGRYAYESLDEAFPVADPNLKPYGNLVVVQIRTPKKKTSGGILLTDETQDTEVWNTQVAKVISAGPLAFRNRDTMTPWPEGAWVSPGDYVRVPKFGGDKWSAVNERGEVAVYQLVRDLDLRGEVPDPLASIAYI